MADKVTIEVNEQNIDKLKTMNLPASEVDKLHKFELQQRIGELDAEKSLLQQELEAIDG